jgi:hypothetical protein
MAPVKVKIFFMHAVYSNTGTFIIQVYSTFESKIKSFAHKTIGSRIDATPTNHIIDQTKSLD